MCGLTFIYYMTVKEVELAVAVIFNAIISSFKYGFA